MSNKTNKTKKALSERRPMSEMEKIEARLLYRQGKSQSQIADLLGFSGKTISRLKQKNGNEWEKERMPKNLSLPRLIELIHELIYIEMADAVTQRTDSFRRILNISRLTGALRSLEELNEAVTLRNRVQDSEHLMEWMIEKKYSRNLEQIQQYHDEQLNLM